jgi:4-nitrophenyl phosphatase
MTHNFDLTKIHALAIDMDGVLWRGDTALPGLNKFFNFLDRQQIPFMLATNNASKTPEQYQKKFAGFGVKIRRENVLTSSLATAAYLQNEIPAGSRVFVVGQAGLIEAMRGAGFEVMPDSSQPVAAVVAGIDFTVTYDKLKHAGLLIQRGAIFVGSNGDLTFPAEEGYYPGAGSILAAIEAASGVKPTVIGKPQPLMFKIALQKMGSEPAHTAMVGDRLETDILGGQRAGLKTILVTTGVDNETTIPIKKVRPNAIFSGIDELADTWQNQLG